MFEQTFNGTNDLLNEAEKLFREAYRHQSAGDLEAAIVKYRQSIHAFPTAEAYTFLGWALSLKGLPYEAISECKTAIAIDPDFGNPYNDIGAYLMGLDQVQEAIPWLEKAKEAKRYEARHYPYFNMGKIYEKSGQWMEAIREFERALEIFPKYKAAEEALGRVLLMLNRRN